MCGRYVLAEKPEKIYAHYKIESNQNYNNIPLLPSYNITPGSIAGVITKNSPYSLRLMKWGLLPSWSKNITSGYKMINARAETVFTKPAFKDLIKHKRCLVPATGFYEWKKSGNGEKIPYLFTLKNNDLFSFAALYDVWVDAEKKELYTFSIITVNANTLMAPIHDRMPAILDRNNEDKWLDSETETPEIERLLKPFDSNMMTCYQVSSAVNNPVNNSPELLKKV